MKTNGQADESNTLNRSALSRRDFLSRAGLGARTEDTLASGIDDGALLGTTSEGGHGRSPLPADRLAQTQRT